jgi:hypothetical protein
MPLRHKVNGMASPAPQRIARVRWEAHDPRHINANLLAAPFANLAGWRLGMLTSLRGASGVVCSASGLPWGSTANPMRRITLRRAAKRCGSVARGPVRRASATEAVRTAAPLLSGAAQTCRPDDAMTSGLGLRD